MDNLEKLPEERLQTMDLVEKAHLMISGGAYQDALELLEKAEQTDPMYIRIYMERGNLYSMMDDYDLAETAYQQALMLDKADGELYYYIGNLRMLQENAAEAVQMYREAENNGYEDEQVYNNMGIAYEMTDNLKAAQTCYLRASMINPEWPEPVMRRINVAYELNELDRARELCQEALVRFVDEEDAYTLMMAILMARGEYEQAEEFLSAAVQLFPKSFELKLHGARVAALKDEYDRALSMLTEMREIAPADDALDAVDLLESEIDMILSKVDEAIACYERMVDREKDGAVNEEARFQLINAYATTKQYEKLLKYCNSTLNTVAVDGQLCIAYVMQPFALENLGRMDEAMMIYRDALMKYRKITLNDRSRSDARLYRVMCLRGLKEYAQALEELQFCEKLTPENKIVLMLKATLLRESGDVAAAENIEAELKKAAEQMQ